MREKGKRDKANSQMMSGWKEGGYILRNAPVLYIQLNNTVRENKNQYVTAFLAYIVQAGIFSEVGIAK